MIFNKYMCLFCGKHEIAPGGHVVLCSLIIYIQRFWRAASV